MRWPRRGRAPVARHHRRDQRHPRGKGGARGIDHDARLSRRAGASALGARQPLRLFQDAPATLIPRRRRFEISERIGADGAIVTSLAENEIDELIVALKAARVDAIAVSLVFSFLNPEHERRLGARLRAALPDVPVYLSSDVLPEIKEFERTSTTAVCAYVGPILASYLARLEAGHAQPGAAAALSDGIERRHSRSGRGHRHAGHGGRSRVPQPASSRRPWWRGKPRAQISSRSTWAAPPPRQA